MDLITLNKYYFPLLHGAGGKYDELIIFGGMALVLIGLGFLSWRASEAKNERRRKRKIKRHR